MNEDEGTTLAITICMWKVYLLTVDNRIFEPLSLKGGSVAQGMAEGTGDSQGAENNRG